MALRYSEIAKLAMAADCDVKTMRLVLSGAPVSNAPRKRAYSTLQNHGLLHEISGADVSRAAMATTSKMRRARMKKMWQDPAFRARMSRPEKAFKTILTPDMVREARIEYAKGETTFQALGVRFGVSKITISKAIRRVTHRGVR